MNCYEYESHLTAFLDGDLSSNLRKEFIQHKSDCSDCDQTYQEFKQTVSAIRGLKQRTTSPGFNERLYARIRNEKQTTIWQDLQSWLPDMRGPRYVMATAVVAVVALISYTTILDTSPESTRQQSQQPVERSVIPPPALNIQQPVAAEGSGTTPEEMVTESESSDTNRAVPPKSTRSFEGQIKYVNSD